MTEPIRPKAPIRITAHYFTRQEFFRAYITLSSGYPEGVNLGAFYHAIMRHQNLSRSSRHVGNNLDAYIKYHMSDEKMKSIRSDFDEVIKSYDHGLMDPVVIDIPCNVMQAYWVCAMGFEVMDFDIPFISITCGALVRSVMDFFGVVQDEAGEVLDIDARPYAPEFSFATPSGKKGPELNIAQHLWDAMVDRDVAIHYTEKYIKHLLKSEEEEEAIPPTSKHLH